MESNMLYSKHLRITNTQCSNDCIYIERHYDAEQIATNKTSFRASEVCGPTVDPRNSRSADQSRRRRGAVEFRKNKQINFKKKHICNRNISM